jgi:hypothetical protein
MSERTGIEFDQIKLARSQDHNAYREDLIRIGKEMVSSGDYPAIECFKRGFSIVDGIRLADEMTSVQNWAKENKHDLFHMHIIGRSEGTDSTQAEELREMSDMTLVNAGSLDQLYAFLENFVRKQYTLQEEN